MSGGILAKFARQAVPPEYRAEAFIVGEPRLTWTSLFYDDFPNAEVYLVGGSIRDAILGKVPSDIDLVIRNIHPDKLEHWLSAHGACDFVGRTFGTFKFVPHGCGGSEPIDIALPRTESMQDEHKSGRRDMQISTDYRLPIKEDLARRDYTINAMAYELRQRRLIDPLLGLNDIYAELICAVHNPEKRFEEDATRILRGLRFASQLGFSIESKTWRAIQDNISLLNKTTLNEEGTYTYSVPRELIGREFLIGFRHHPVHTLDLWEQSGTLELFLPLVAKLANELDAQNQPELDTIKRTLHLLHKKEFLSEHEVRTPSLTVLVAALLTHNELDSAHHAYHTCKDLFFNQFPKHHKAFVNCKDVMWFVDQINFFEKIDPASMRPSTFEHMFMNARGRELLMLIHATYISEGVHSVGRERLHTARRIAQRMEDFYKEEGYVDHLPRLISGTEIAASGIEAGPIYRELLDKIRDAQLTRQIHTTNEAKDLLQKFVSEL